MKNFRPDGGLNRSFDFPIFPNEREAPSKSFNFPGSVTNLFYWVNILHDISYVYGFTEPAGKIANHIL